MAEQMTRKEQLEWWIEYYRRAPSVACPPEWIGVDTAGQKDATVLHVRCGDKYRSVDFDDWQGLLDHQRLRNPPIAPAMPKPLPKGATRHKALPAACLVTLGDRAAFIGRWEQKCS